MSITVKNFVEEFKNKNIKNTQFNPTAVEDFIRDNLEIKTYIPFTEKRKIVEMVVAKNLSEEHGVKKIDSIGLYISFITAILVSHTNLDFSENPVDDYDLLSELGLLERIVGLFEKDHAECDILLKMASADALSDNNINAIISRFLDGILDKLDGVSEGLKEVMGNFDWQSLFGSDFKQEDLTQLKGLLNKYNK